MDDKDSLRRNIRARRSEYVAHHGEAALSLAFSKAPTPLAQLFASRKIVAGYVAVGSEADPMRLLAEAEQVGATIALPHVTSRAAPMRFLRWNVGDPLEQGPFNLMQPAADSPQLAPDLCLVPLVGFDRDGNRLGQGAGHYDRALSLLPDCFRVGLAWSVQEVTALPADPWDQPLDAICTEKEWIVS